ncbi:MAG TPA: hypothetical protein VGJ41_00540 [Nocardioides sp.]|jgi:hypothetical protein
MDATKTFRLLATAAAVVCLLGLGYAGYLWYLTATDTSEDPLVGVGYVFAVMVGLPCLYGLFVYAAALATHFRSVVTAFGAGTLAFLGVGVVLAVPWWILTQWLY